MTVANIIFTQEHMHSLFYRSAFNIAASIIMIIRIFLLLLMMTLLMWMMMLQMC